MLTQIFDVVQSNVELQKQVPQNLCLLQEVTLQNVEEYVDLVYDLCLNSGIRRQMDAFRGLLDFIAFS